MHRWPHSSLGYATPAKYASSHAGPRSGVGLRPTRRPDTLAAFPFFLDRLSQIMELVAIRHFVGANLYAGGSVTRATVAWGSRAERFPADPPGDALGRLAGVVPRLVDSAQSGDSARTGGLDLAAITLDATAALLDEANAPAADARLGDEQAADDGGVKADLSFVHEDAELAARAVRLAAA